ncbi:uncharacterized protein KY384_003312 [Bacidia gigantensis]|uniref:uncharacterized protein n=1 Tax=Bacidia gigantensis TaxID=2732470 RepID=UPI001D043D78|nr:uncharacterized protein KY384_003312 [Bacidia gigantensis]KAG8531680.1 hypothetical protein KY384_003312 [Bacidia gigantensis]
MLRSRLKPRACSQNVWKCYSTSTSAAPASPIILSRIRDDMKVAMRAKDTPRLDVLRGLIADATNAAKASNVAQTDSHMLQIIRKRIKNSEGAAQEAEHAHRNDLRDKELSQLSILQAYIEDSNVLSEDAVRASVLLVVETLRRDGQAASKGGVIKKLLGPGGTLDGQLVDKKEVARMVESML